MGAGDASAVVEDADGGAGGVAGAVVLAFAEGGGEGAADDAQGGGEHQQGDEAAGGDGVAGDAAQSLHQPAGAEGADEAGEQGQQHRKEAHYQQAEGNQAQGGAEQQGEVYFQVAAAEGAGEGSAAAGDLPPQKGDDGEGEQVQIVAVDEGGAGGAGAGLPELDDALAGGGEGGQGEDDDGQGGAGGAHSEGGPGEGDGGAGRGGVKDEAAQGARQQGGEEGAGEEGGGGEEQSFHQGEDANLDSGGAPAFEHGDFAGAGADDHTGGDGEVVGEDAGDQEHHQKEGDARQEEGFGVVVQDAGEAGAGAAVGEAAGDVAADGAEGGLEVGNAGGGDALAVNLEEPGGAGVDAGVAAPHLLAQGVGGYEKRDEGPVVIVVGKEFLAAVPVFGIGVGGCYDADDLDLGFGLTAAAGGGYDAETLAEGDVEEVKSGLVDGYFYNDAVGVAGGVVVAGSVGQGRPASGD